MNRTEFSHLAAGKYLVLDGATGTFLQESGMPAGVCPEQWALDNPQVLKNIHTSYKNAGSNIAYTCTFGANRLKLETYGLQDKVYQYNRDLAKLAKDALGRDVYCAGSIGPLGHFIEPMGTLTFEQAYDIFQEQIRGLADGGADILVIETMIDIQETRAALLAALDTCELPVIVSLTFGDDGRTLTGSDPATAVITLQSLGADAIGTNCSTGPDKMLEVIKRMKPYARIPLMAKPNAGLPSIIDGKTVFNLTARQFSKYVPSFMENGVTMMGGCCGTSPDFIKEISTHFCGKTPLPIAADPVQAVTSRSKTVFFDSSKPALVIGERINPTGKKTLSAQLKEGVLNEVKRFAVEQKNGGADILDVNVGVPGIDEEKTMRAVITSLSSFSELPLCIDSSDPAVIETALKVYPGRALVNSISAESEKMDKLAPVIKKYNPMVIFLPIDDNGIPQTARERTELIEKTAVRFEQSGIRRDQLVVDGLVMTVSSAPQAPKETLETIGWCTGNNLLTTIGLSNVSFGLPNRNNVNSAFCAMAVARGISSVIINPCHDEVMNIFHAANVLTGRDANALAYINAMRETAGAPKQHSPTHALDCADALLQGNKEALLEAVKEELAKGRNPLAVVNESLIPGIQQVGEKFNCKELFLPQLMLATEAMQEAFAYLKPMMVQDESNKAGRMIIATVEGDIHDIGKNMVSLMLRNHGIEVVDLGKDVDADTILDTAEREKISVIGLSALMTTTMVAMKEVICRARQENKPLRFVVGGAVVTPEYAKEIGADGYAKDAVQAVDVVKRLLS